MVSALDFCRVEQETSATCSLPTWGESGASGRDAADFRDAARAAFAEDQQAKQREVRMGLPRMLAVC